MVKDYLEHPLVKVKINRFHRSQFLANQILTLHINLLKCKRYEINCQPKKYLGYKEIVNYKTQ